MKINRRTMLASFALLGARAEAQEPGGGTVYIPKAHLVEDREFLHGFMDEFAFVDLVTASPALRITHIPSILDRHAGPYGTIYGHVSRQNPQSQTFDGEHSAVIVFHGPHGYISPTWYEKKEVVPTWNFAVVHASGKLQPLPGRDALLGLLTKLVDKFEGQHDGPRYSLAGVPDSYKFGLMEGIIGFRMEIETLEGKFKLGQERSEADKEGVLRNLPRAKPQRSLYDLTASFYKRPKAAG